ncbi:DUF4347 domain-containing protein, partial [Microcoleus sp. Z1_B5]|uniref:DUF4347 domain-containing protein n=1 Tax=Microcoleus sp. Z1_B5 TaxID=3055430 RepID=UPI002FD23539
MKTLPQINRSLNNNIGSLVGCTSNKPTEIVILDPTIPDSQHLISGIKPDTATYILQSQPDAVEQIATILAQHTDINALHIITHGDSGSLYLGTTELNSNNIQNYSYQLQQWRNSLTENANIILYGCNLAAGDRGNQFLTQLHQLTGANISANSQPTGNCKLGGTWDILQLIPPSSEAPQLALTETTLKTYSHILATANPDSKAITVNSPQVSIDVLANDTGSSRVSVNSITTAPTNGTAIINDWIYVGGFFTTIGGQTRNRIARLNSDGSVDATFNPNANGDVRAIALDSSGNPIVGGFFTTIGGSTRNRIAKLNPSTGVADATFNPNASGQVLAIATDSSGNPIVGGFFTNIGGQPRNYIAKLNPTTGAADATFNPNANNLVSAIALDSSGNPIVGNQFTTIGGSIRNRIAKLNPSTGVADATFNPNASFDVRAIALDSSGNPIVGGSFTTIGGQPRNYIAKLNPATGVADATFNPNANSQVNAIALDSSGNPIVGGPFTTIGGQARNRIAKLNPSTGVADATFNPNASSTVSAIALDSSGNPIVGGNFTTIGGSTRNYIAKLNPSTGVADATFNPNGSGQVNAIAIDKGRSIYYTPNANFNGEDTFYYTATDGVVSLPTLVTVLVNDSPTLDNSGTPILNPQNQNDSASTGTLISTIITNLGGTKITDPNTSAKQGIAISALDTANGTWQYTTDGTTWNNAPAVSAANALLLASDANTSLRFVPNLGFNGTVTNAITFAAWDQITGDNGTTANYTTDRSTNTTSSVFSSATETANITVNPFPTITSVSAANPNGTYSIGTNIDITVQFSAIVNVTNTPQLSLSLAGAAPVADYLSGTGTNTLTFRYTIAAGDNTADLDYLSTTALSLSGGTIKNATNGDAILTLPTLGAANSLGVNKDLVIDTVPPIVFLTPDSPLTTINAPFLVYANFSENVTGFDPSDINVGNGTVSGFTGSGSNYRFTVIPTASGDVTVYLPAATAIDAAGNYNAPAPPIVRTADITPPTVVLTSTSPTTTNAPFIVTATFSETVTGFAATDVTVANGTVSGFTGTGTTYEFTVTPTATGNVTVDIPAATATDTIGNSNTAAIQLTRTADITPPNVILTSTSPTTTNAPFLVTATFSETVTGFAATDVTVANGTVSGFTGTGATYNFTVTPTANGDVTVDIPAATATDTAGNNNTAATQLVRTVETVAPTVALTSASPTTTNAPFIVTATFSETVTGFTDTDVTVANGTVSGFTGTGATYNFTVTPTANGDVTVDIPAATATDTAGNNNTPATQLVRTVETVAPTVALTSASPTTT